MHLYNQILSYSCIYISPSFLTVRAFGEARTVTCNTQNVQLTDMMSLFAQLYGFTVTTV